MPRGPTPRVGWSERATRGPFAHRPSHGTGRGNAGWEALREPWDEIEGSVRVAARLAKVVERGVPARGLMCSAS